MKTLPLPKSRLRRWLDRLAIGFALVFAYVLVLVGVLTALNIVSPPLAEEQQVTLFFSVVCAMVVVGFSVLLQRFQTLPEDLLKTPYTDDSVVPMIRNLRIRSRLFKLGAAAAFVLVVAATLLGFTVAQGQFSDQTGQDQSTGGTVTGTAVTALVLLLFLLRTLASIYRHNMRLAAFYDSRADYLQAGGKTKGLDEVDLLSVFSTAEVDLGWAESLKRAVASHHGSRSVPDEPVARRPRPSDAVP